MAFLKRSLYDETYHYFIFRRCLGNRYLYCGENCHQFISLRILIKGADKLISDGKINKKLFDKNQLEMEQRVRCATGRFLLREYEIDLLNQEEIYLLINTR